VNAPASESLIAATAVKNACRHPIAVSNNPNPAALAPGYFENAATSFLV